MTSIILPVMSNEDSEKFKAACQAIGDSLNCEISSEEVISLKISWHNARGDVASVINKLAEVKTKKKAYRDIMLGQLSEDFTDPKNL